MDATSTGSFSTGSGIGTLTFGPVLQHILQRYGLATSLRILSGVSVLLMLTALTYKSFRTPLEDLFEVRRQPGPFFDLGIWQNKAFCVYTGAVSLFMLGYFIPYVHLVGSLQFSLCVFAKVYNLGPFSSPEPAILLLSVRDQSLAQTISYPESSGFLVRG